MVVNRSNAYRVALFAGTLIWATCAAFAQSMSLRDPSISPKPPAPISATDPVVQEGLFKIDIVVANSAGNPFSDLAPWDFKLLDNDQPIKIRTLHNSQAPSEPAPELIFVLDAINLSPQQLTQAEMSIVRFLQLKNACLGSQCVLYRLTREGLFASLRPEDGALLTAKVEQKRPLWKIGEPDQRQINSFSPREAGALPSSLSLRALGAISIDQRDTPGRKIVVWIGSGWPVSLGPRSFDQLTELSTRLRDARITLDNVNVWPNAQPSWNQDPHLEAPRSQKEMQPADMALQTIAKRTGGIVLDSSAETEPDLNHYLNLDQELDEKIARCVRLERSFYTLTFNPPRTLETDEYHDLRVEVQTGTVRAGMNVRAPAGYYNEPVYFDGRRPGIEKISVAQLEELVHSQTNLLQKLENLELTERLSSPRLDALLNVVHGERERQALTADADLSFPLSPPPDEIVNRSPPEVEEQRAILRRTFDYLQNVIPKLPDFYALRSTVRFEEAPARIDESWKMLHRDQTLHSAASEHATVLYRNGNEEVEKKKAISKSRVAAGARTRQLETRGTFGPILAFVLAAAVKSPGDLRWKRWERGKYGDLAVFSYRVAATNDVPELTYCCLPQGTGATPYHNKADSYGEFAVNPETGAIMRIMISADLNEDRNPEVPLIRSQLMVEYGPVELGGKTYICPQRSVEISRGRSERELHEWGMMFIVYGYFETMINDVTFGGYHKFGSEARILPEFEEAGEPQKSGPPQVH